MKPVLLMSWIVTLGLLMLSLTAQAQHAPGTHGRNVTQITYSTGNHTMGRFEQKSNQQWIEYSDHNNSRFNFSEQNRDDWSVYLYDASRDVHIQLDLQRKKVGYRQGNQAMSDIYNIIGSKNNEYVEQRNDRQQNKADNRHNDRHVTRRVESYNAPRDLRRDTRHDERHYYTPPVVVALVRDSVSYTLADNSIMVLEHKGPSSWIEYSPQDNEIYQYEETSRTDSSVYLYDASNNLQAQIDFTQNIVIFTREQGPDPKYFFALNAVEQHQASQYQPGEHRHRMHHDHKRDHHRHRHNQQQQSVQIPPAQISGYTVSRVVYGEGKKPLGEFVKSGKLSWTQYIKHSGITYHFEEQRRNQYIVYLYDTAHNAHVMLDLRSNKVTYGEEFKLMFDKYDILRSEL